MQPGALISTLPIALVSTASRVSTLQKHKIDRQSRTSQRIHYLRARSFRALQVDHLTSTSVSTGIFMELAWVDGGVDGIPLV